MVVCKKIRKDKEEEKRSKNKAKQKKNISVRQQRLKNAKRYR